MNEGYSKVFVALDGTEQQDFVLARAIRWQPTTARHSTSATSSIQPLLNLPDRIRLTW